MYGTAKEWLEALDTWFSLYTTTTEEKRRLWAVLAALRGPDDVTYSKSNTTGIIRAKAFPITTGSARGAEVLGTTNVMGGFAEAMKAVGSGRNEHFATHIATAVEALKKMYPEPTPVAQAPNVAAGFYDPAAAIIKLGKVQD